jgi:GAF domain-containing protein
VTVRRHMNVPIFEGDRIVAVLGAGNKTAPYDESDVRQLTLLGQGMWRLLQRKRADEALREARNQLEAARRAADDRIACRQRRAAARTVPAAHADGPIAARDLFQGRAEPVPADQSCAERYVRPGGTCRGRG